MINYSNIDTKLASLLLYRKLITKEQLLEISHNKDVNKNNFLSHIIDNKIIDGRKFMIESSTILRLQYLDMSAINVNFLPRECFDTSFCKENQCLPLFIRNNSLYVAIANPIESREILKKLRNMYDFPFVAVIVELSLLKDKINDFEEFLKEEGTNDDKMEDNLGDVDLDMDFVEESDFDDDDLINGGDDDEAPIIRFINNTIVDAIQKGASDIHFEPYEKNFRIRYRIDGLLMETFNTTKNLGPKIVSRLKIMSSLDIAEKRIPQDGKFKISLSKEKIHRFSCQFMSYKLW